MDERKKTKKQRTSAKRRKARKRKRNRVLKIIGIILLLLVIIANSSSERFSFKLSFEFSSITPDEISTKHNGGKREHHQFCPSAFPIFILNAS